MNAKTEKALLWAAVTLSTFAGIGFFLSLFESPERHEYSHQMGRGHRGGAEFYPAHHGSDFSWIGIWLFLAAAGAVVIFVFRWFKKKGKVDAFQKFVTDAPVSNTSPPINKSNADILDNWEKEQTVEEGNNEHGDA
ncbi:hypothetical protein [Domibacillus robiginosus]|uniref:hypothetical protein n=1 Tax=Domibacillus robiginosus TaxID=1071054 RepID=UPI00067B0472|nr:hypothetical protein [Domibacillus robiginosus]